MAHSPRIPRIAVSMGDPGGVGPEVLVKALSDASLRSRAHWIITGEARAMERARAVCGATLAWSATPEPATRAMAAGQIVVREHPTLRMPAGGWKAKPSAAGGALSLWCVQEAITLAKGGIDAVVTGPISKEAWVLAGESRFPGHTELFAHEFASPQCAMMFAAEPARGPVRPGAFTCGLHVILATAHVPLAKVAGGLTRERVLEVILLGASAMRGLGFESPRVGVCGLNPHAGEHGVLGTEDDAIIAPAIAEARARGVEVVGPLPGDTIFPGALASGDQPPRRFDLVVAMYHDQGLIPLKLLAFDRAVNMTVGLRWNGREIIRTSPDHGTAYDIAGKGVADEGSMKAALEMAVKKALRHCGTNE